MTEYQTRRRIMPPPYVPPFGFRAAHPGGGHKKAAP